MFYKKLNEVLSNVVKDKNCLLELNNSYILSKLFFDSVSINIQSNNDKKFMDLNESINLATSFFKNINPIYSIQFQNMIKECIDGNLVVNFCKKKFACNQYFDFSGVDENGKVYIEYENSIYDVFTLVHEAVHYFSTQNKVNSNIKKVFGEVSSMTMELLLEEYLKENTNYDIDDIESRKQTRIFTTFDDAVSIIFEKKLVDLYLLNGQINEDILNKYLNSMDKSSQEFLKFSKDGKFYLKEIVDSKQLRFNKRVRYVIGYFMSLYLINNKDLLFELIRILGNSNLTYDNDMDLLEKLKFPCIKNKKFILTIDDIKVFENLINLELFSIKNK